MKLRFVKETNIDDEPIWFTERWVFPLGWLYLGGLRRTESEARKLVAASPGAGSYSYSRPARGSYQRERAATLLERRRLVKLRTPLDKIEVDYNPPGIDSGKS